MEAGVALAQDLKARVLLVHAIPRLGPVLGGGMTGDPDPWRDLVQAETAEDEATELSSDWAQWARKQGVEVDVAAAVHAPAKYICEQAAAAKAMIVVVGTHGRTGLRRLTLGSVAERVVRHADRPVLTVPPAPR